MSCTKADERIYLHVSRAKVIEKSNFIPLALES
jgi:hypothetical protein